MFNVSIINLYPILSEAHAKYEKARWRRSFRGSISVRIPGNLAWRTTAPGQLHAVIPPLASRDAEPSFSGIRVYLTWSIGNPTKSANQEKVRKPS